MGRCYPGAWTGSVRWVSFLVSSAAIPDGTWTGNQAVQAPHRRLVSRRELERMNSFRDNPALTPIALVGPGRVGNRARSRRAPRPESRLTLAGRDGPRSHRRRRGRCCSASPTARSRTRPPSVAWTPHLESASSATRAEPPARCAQPGDGSRRRHLLPPPAADGARRRDRPQRRPGGRLRLLRGGAGAGARASPERWEWALRPVRGGPRRLPRRRLDRLQLPRRPRGERGRAARPQPASTTAGRCSTPLVTAHGANWAESRPCRADRADRPRRRRPPSRPTPRPFASPPRSWPRSTRRSRSVPGRSPGSRGGPA